MALQWLQSDTTLIIASKLRIKGSHVPNYIWRIGSHGALARFQA
jgi:hypothetical protein